MALIDSELLRGLGIPIFLMLDNTSARFVDDLKRGRITPGGTKEERVLSSLAVALRNGTFGERAVPLEVPDIVWTLPEDAVRQVAPRFAGWKQATAALKGRRGAVNPKIVLQDEYDLRVTLPTLGRIITIARARQLEPSPALKGAVAAVLSSIDRPPTNR